MGSCVALKFTCNAELLCIMQFLSKLYLGDGCRTHGCAAAVRISDEKLKGCASPEVMACTGHGLHGLHRLSTHTYKFSLCVASRNPGVKVQEYAPQMLS